MSTEKSRNLMQELAIEPSINPNILLRPAKRIAISRFCIKLLGSDAVPPTLT
jgi:hypothetical protein